MATTETIRRRLSVQGFTLSTKGVRDFQLGLRLSTSLCAAITLIGTIQVSPPILWTLAATALLGAILPFHPFDLAYNYGLRFLASTAPLPRNAAPRRFACAVGTIWLIATGLAFHAGVPLAGYILGGSMVAVSGLVSLTHICIPSMVYRMMFR